MALDEGELKALSDIDEHGWHCMKVGAGDGEPHFAYSVGFSFTLGAPEFIIFGLDWTLMHSMLWEVFRQIKAGGAPVDAERRWSGLIEGFDCVSCAVHPTQLAKGHFGWALWHHRYRGWSDECFRAMQLFWPGKAQGLLPWETGCVEEVREFQPRLDLPDEVGLS